MLLHGVVPNPRVCNFVGLGWGPDIGISNKFPGAAAPAGPGTLLWEPLVCFITLPLLLSQQPWLVPFD